MAAIILLKAHVKGYTRHDGTVVKPHDDKRQAARIVTRPDGVRYNPDLPRGTLPKYDHPDIQASLKRKTEALARVSAAWNDATEKLVAKYLPKIEAAGIKGEMAKKAARTMASMNPMDTEISPEFSEHRVASAEAMRISDEHHDVVAAHYGEPEFESMRQPGQFDRPQIRTPEFKKWFGGSKVVNAKGEPLIVMHGSNKDFSEFRGSDRQQPDQANNNWFGELGSWFAAPSSSGSYEEGNAEATADVFSELRGDDKGDNAGVVYPVFLSIKNPAEFDSYDELTDERDAAGGAAKFRAKMIAAGHDGIVLRDSDTDGGQYRDDWVAFHPHQIKSAMGNNGQFNPADADMTKSAGPVLLLAKANVKAHARRLPSGKVVQVNAHTDRRHTTLVPGQMALFTRPEQPTRPNPYKGKDPVKDTPDLFEHIDPPRAAPAALPPAAPEPAPPAEPPRPAKPHPLERSRATMAEYQKDHDDAVAEGDTGTAEFMQHLLSTHREGHEALETAFAHFDKHGDGLELSHKDGRRHVIFLPDASNPGKYRYQMFDARGMMSHSTHDSPEEAVADAASSGYTVHNPGVLDKLASTEEWEEGMAINALIQAHGSGQFDYAEMMRRVRAVQDEFKARREPAMAKALDFGTVAPTVLSFKAALLSGLVPQC